MNILRIKLFVTIIVIASTASALPTSWYVDNALATGNNDGTSWADAWHSFSAVNWANVHAGDTVYISGGITSQAYTQPFTISANGTATQPITIAAGTDAGHNGIVVFDYAALNVGTTTNAITLTGNYLRITGNVGGESHIQIKNLFTTNTSTARSGGRGFYSTSSRNITIDHISFANVDNPIHLETANASTISNCQFAQVRGDAAILIGSSGTWDANKIFGNTIEVYWNSSSGQGPDGIQGGDGLSIYNNTFTATSTSVATSTQHTDFLQMVGNYLKIYGNTFTNIGDSAIDFDTYSNSSPHDVWIYNNIFRIVTALDTYPDYIRMYNSTGSTNGSVNNFKVYNNLFVDNPDSSGWCPSGPLSLSSACPIRIGPLNGPVTATGNEFKNNIFYNTGTSSVPVIGIANNVGSAGSFTYSNNVFYSPSGQTVIINNQGTVAAATAFDAAAKTSSPSFISYTPQGPTNDFHLLSTDTVATDSGISLSAYFATDKDGVTRPQGAAWDIGPYEFTTNSVVLPPTGLTATVH